MKKEHLHIKLKKIVGWVLENTEVAKQETIADTIGVHRTTLSSAINGDMRYVTAPLLEKLKKSFPECPFVDENPASYPNNVVSDGVIPYGAKREVPTIPLLPISAQGGSLNDFLGSVKEFECERIISPIKGIDFAITVSGESMAPEYPNGSQVLAKKVNEAAFIEWGEVYVLDTCNGTVIKKLLKSDNPDCVICTSINPDPSFAPFEICKKDIYGVYRVLMCMARK
ncbi:S24 family peptidase [Geofilum rhodophaeum]|uniref:S24 family peptidase n=1 Tax=Geofilum rhodophaeum TaxID=1965019 RepID=UPI00197A70E9|nr:helix-turn-helix transcriptional regulator [Geofilum rhodophaeum]